MSKWEMPESGSFRYLNPVRGKELQSRRGGPPIGFAEVYQSAGDESVCFDTLSQVRNLQELFCPKMERAAGFPAARSIARELYYH